jgi:hypothetical protein
VDGECLDFRWDRDLKKYMRQKAKRKMLRVHFPPFKKQPGDRAAKIPERHF